MSCDRTLKEKGYKLTPQRRMVLDLLHESRAHLTAEDIVNRIHMSAPDINKSTVYRTLELLEELGLVVRSALGGRFIYHHRESGQHHHFVCRSCGSIINGDENLLNHLKKSLQEGFDFQPDLKHMVIYGLCGACREQN
jgi:Fur family ferric uptake transcriptional regulator